MNKINKVFCLDLEVIEKLKEYPSASSFVNELLKEYFFKTAPIKEKLEEKKKELDIINNEVIEIENKVIEIEQDEEIQKQEQERQLEDYESSEDKWEKTKRIQRENLLRYDIPKEEFEDTLDEFINLLRDKQVVNLIEFCQILGIKKKQCKNILEGGEHEI